MAFTNPPGVNPPSRGTVHLNITDAGPAPKVYAYWNNKTYEVNVFEISSTGGERDVTHTRDWTQVANDVLKYLESLENATDASGERFAFAQFKTADVTLNGPVATAATGALHANAPATVTSVKWDVTVTNNPQRTLELSTIPAAVQPQIMNTLTQLGRNLATFSPYQAPALSPSITPTGTNTPPSGTTPPSATPPTDTTTPLPALTFTPTPRPAFDEQAALTAFLNKQATGTPASAINPAQTAQSATNILGAQLAQLGFNYNAVQLQKGAATRIAEHPTDFATQEDIKEMFDILKGLYDQTATPDAQAALKAQLSDGASNSSKINTATYDDKLVNCLANKEAAELDSTEIPLIAKAYANLISNTQVNNTQAYPKVFFKALHAFFNAKAPEGMRAMFFGGEEQSQGLNLVIVEETTPGNYKFWQRLPASGVIRPDRTAFVLYKSSEAAGKYSGFNRTAMSARNPLVASQPQSDAPTPDYYRTQELAVDVGARGNCGAYALADAVLQKDHTYYGSETEWKAALEIKKVDIRNEAMEHLFNQADTFAASDELFAEVLNGINESRADIVTRQSANAPHMTRLLNKAAGTLTPEEKKWLVQLYAVYAREEGNDLDKPFYLAYAMKTGQKIAIIQGNQIIYTAPPARDNIDFDGYLFVDYNGSNHFRSVNRERSTQADPATLAGEGRHSLADIIADYNQNNAYLFSRREFLASLTTPNTVQAKLALLKATDPHGYLVVQSVAGSELTDDVSAGTGDVNTLITAIINVQTIEPEMNRRTDLKARVDFFKVLARAKVAQASGSVPVAIETELRESLNRLKTEDTLGFFALQQQLLGNDGLGPNIMSELPVIDFTRTRNALLRMDLGTVEQARIPQMALTGAQTLHNRLIRDNQLTARATFFQSLLEAPTSGPLSQSQIDRIRIGSNNLLYNDPNAFFAYRQFFEQNPSVNLIDQRSAVIAYILNHRSDPLITARAAFITAIQSQDATQIRTSLENLQRVDARSYLALEALLGNGASTTSEQMTEYLQDRSKRFSIPDFINTLNSPFIKARSEFLTALSAPPSEARTAELREKLEQLNSDDLVSYLAIEEHLKENGIDVTIENIAGLTAQQVKDSIGAGPHLQTRAAFILLMQHIKAMTPVPEQAIQALNTAIINMFTQDVHGWLALVELMRPTNTGEIVNALLGNSQTFDQLRAAFDASIDNPVILARADLLKELKNPAATVENLGPKLTAVTQEDPHGLLVFGKMIHDIAASGTNTALPLPPAPLLTSVEQIAYGIEQIRTNPLLIQQINLLDFANLLLTTRVNDAENDLIQA